MSNLELKTKRFERPRRGQRKILLLAITFYVACFHWIYVGYLNPTFDSMGYNYYPPGLAYMSLAIVLSLLPCLWMPLVLTRPSQFAYWVLYITVLIPSMFVPLYAGYETPREVAILMIVFFVSFALTGSSYLVPLRKLERRVISRKAFAMSFSLLTILLTLWMVVVFRHHFQIVSFNDIYDLRDAANDLAEGSLVNYAFMPLTGAINPVLMGYGILYRRRWIFIAGALGQLLVYSVLGTKGSILSVIFIPGVYGLLQIKKIPFGLNIASAAAALMAGMCLLYYFSGSEPGVITTLALFVVMVRTLTMGGLTTAQYYDFFLHNPHTYWSHLKLINMFLHYPYAYPVGQELGIAYAGTTALDATTHFYATDGIEAAGLPGLLLIGLFAALVFLALDSASQHRDTKLAVLMTAYAAFNLANISMFTSLLSGGLGLLMVLLYFMPRQAANQRVVGGAGSRQLARVHINTLPEPKGP